MKKRKKDKKLLKIYFKLQFPWLLRKLILITIIKIIYIFMQKLLNYIVVVFGVKNKIMSAFAF